MPSLSLPPSHPLQAQQPQFHHSRLEVSLLTKHVVLLCFLHPTPPSLPTCLITAESEEPVPAKASKKGRKKKAEVEAELAAAAAEAAAAGLNEQAGGLTTWLDGDASAEEDRRRFPYHRCDVIVTVL